MKSVKLENVDNARFNGKGSIIYCEKTKLGSYVIYQGKLRYYKIWKKIYVVRRVKICVIDSLKRFENFCVEHKHTSKTPEKIYKKDWFGKKYLAKV